MDSGHLKRRLSGQKTILGVGGRMEAYKVWSDPHQTNSHFAILDPSPSIIRVCGTPITGVIFQGPVALLESTERVQLLYSMAFSQAQPWHEGEEQMHSLTRVHVRDNPNNPGLTPRAAHQIQIYPLMAVGTIDPAFDSRPWTALWGGEAPISQPVATGGVIGIKTTVDASFDPVVKALLGTSSDGEIVRPTQNQGAMISGLSISLETRGRVKLFGRMIAGALSAEGDEQPSEKDDPQLGRAGNVQVVLKVEQSLGNCPKYLNKKVITAHPSPKPRLVSEAVILPEGAVDLVQQADMFFISSSHKFEDMDTNHRGGSPGFIRVQQPDPSSDVQATTLVWPEYSGNNLYQTLGNLMTTPRAGITIPDYVTGDVLYLTGDTKVLVNNEANAVLPKSKLAVQFIVRGARFVRDGLGFRGAPVEDGPAHGRSPYNPRIRFLRTEKDAEFTRDYNSTGQAASSSAEVTAKLVKKTKLSPTLTKYRFSLSDPSVHGPWKPGQYVAFDLSDELDMGYSQLRDDDPQSINDDYIRTFTVASPPDSLGAHGEDFEVIIRSVGSVTKWLAWQREGMIEAKVLGFGGDFSFIEDEEKNNATSKERRKVFIAQGIGITPLLGQIRIVDDMKVRWTISIKDVGAVLDVVGSCSEALKKNMIVYLTGKDEDVPDEFKHALAKLNESIVKIQRRRLTQEDLVALQDETDDWYMCAAPAMRKVIQDWLPNKSIIFENFDY